MNGRAERASVSRSVPPGKNARDRAAPRGPNGAGMVNNRHAVARMVIADAVVRIA
jgi:hypothetical protein